MIRWICGSCNEKWIYPVDRCMVCKGSIVMQVGRRFIVRSRIQIFIESDSNPKAPYYVYLLEDENGNLMPFKSFSEHEIGEEVPVQRKRYGYSVSSSPSNT